MNRFNYIIVLISFAFSCQTFSQEEDDSEEKIPEKNNIVDEQEVKFNADATDKAIFEKIIKYANDKKLDAKELSEIEIEIAKQLVGTPYVGRTLEKDSIEQLVVNLQELDCTTFLENVLAISICIKNKTIAFDDFCETLLKLRYRNGQINQYPSRLHYTTDWLLNNQEKGLVEIVSNDFAPSNFVRKVNFMSTHPNNYKQLSNPSFVEEMKSHEERISTSKLKFIPKARINEFAKNIKDGDIIAISTAIPGLDFSHVALAAWHNNKLYFYHASTKEKKVVLSDKPLQDYLLGMKNNDGIVVARLN